MLTRPGPRGAALLVFGVLLVAACGGGADPGGTGAPTTAPETSGPATTAPAGPAFAAQVREVPPEVRARMDGVSMRPGCPAGYDDLRYLTLSYLDFDGVARTGELVVHRTVADDVVEVFRTLFEVGYPIRRMELVDEHGADDFASIEADNTSAFNCRRNRGKPGWSEHSWGWAIDLNPIENPFITAEGTTYHPASEPYLDRSVDAPGTVHDGDAVVAAFAAVGWGWGGTWTPEPDIQHFSVNGR